MLGLGLTWTWMSFSTNVSWTPGTPSPGGVLPDRSIGSSQRGVPPPEHVAPFGCVTAKPARKLTRTSGFQVVVHITDALRQPGESYSTVASSLSRGYTIVCVLTASAW